MMFSDYKSQEQYIQGNIFVWISEIWLYKWLWIVKLDKYVIENREFVTSNKIVTLLRGNKFSNQLIEQDITSGWNTLPYDIRKLSSIFTIQNKIEVSFILRLNILDLFCFQL